MPVEHPQPEVPVCSVEGGGKGCFCSVWETQAGDRLLDARQRQCCVGTGEGGTGLVVAAGADHRDHKSRFVAAGGTLEVPVELLGSMVMKDAWFERGCAVAALFRQPARFEIVARPVEAQVPQCRMGPPLFEQGVAGWRVRVGWG